jgi:hypothetical protein
VVAALTETSEMSMIYIIYYIYFRLKLLNLIKPLWQQNYFSKIVFFSLLVSKWPSKLAGACGTKWYCRREKRKRSRSRTNSSGPVLSAKTLQRSWSGASSWWRQSECRDLRPAGRRSGRSSCYNPPFLPWPRCRCWWRRSTVPVQPSTEWWSLRRCRPDTPLTT